jgi:hypothetical protein
MKEINWSMARALLVAVSVVLVAPIARAAAVPPPEPAAQAALATLEISCTPSTFRIGEWVTVECVTHVVNRGDRPLSNVSVSIGSSSGDIPDTYDMWGTRDGKLSPLEPDTPIFRDYGVLQAGQSTESHNVMLLRMSRRTFESEFNLVVGGQTLSKATVRFLATAEAQEPPTDLAVTEELASGGWAGGEQAVTHETKITNRGSRTVDSLTLTERFSPAVLQSAYPPPESKEDALELATWSLASFGKESLAPGESLVLRTIYGPKGGSVCEYVGGGAVVEATVATERERYGARFAGYSGFCVRDVGSGEGPAVAEGGVVWVAFVLAGGGVALVGAALALRRRARLGPRIHW